MYWKSRNTKPTRRYEETILTPPGSPERPTLPQVYPPKKSQSPESEPKEPVPVQKTTLAQALLQMMSRTSPSIEIQASTSKERQSSPSRGRQGSPSQMSPSSPRKGIQGSPSQMSLSSLAKGRRGSPSELPPSGHSKRSPGSLSLNTQSNLLIVTQDGASDTTSVSLKKEVGKLLA